MTGKGTAPMKHLTVGGVDIAYLDEGKGPVVIHRPLLQRLAQRVAAADRDAQIRLARARPRFHRLRAVDTLARRRALLRRRRCGVLLALAKKAKGKLHLVGHSYGAALALEAAARWGPASRASCWSNPSRSIFCGKRPEWAEVERLARPCLAPWQRAMTVAAAKSFMTYWLGRWRWWLSPERFKAAIAATIPKVALEFGFVIDAPTTLQDYAGDHRAHIADRRRLDACAHPRHGRAAGRDVAQREGRDGERRGPYEPVHPSRRDQPADSRLSCFA